MKRLVFAAIAIYGFSSHACLGGSLEKTLSDYGLKSSAKLTVRPGAVQVGELRLKYDAKTAQWCEENLKGNCNSTSLLAGPDFVIKSDGKRFTIFDPAGKSGVVVYSVALAGGVIASTNAYAVDEKGQPKADSVVDEVLANISVTARDPKTGDVSAAGGFTRGLNTSVAGMKRNTFGCEKPKERKPGKIKTH